MIIFDIDGVLANVDHRKHFIEPNECHGFEDLYEFKDFWVHKFTGKPWKPDYEAYHEACDGDDPITSVINLLEYIDEAQEYGSDTPWVSYDDIQIWTGRSELQRKKTEKWLSKNMRHYHKDMPILKMRPIGNTEPTCDLKNRWLYERTADLMEARMDGIIPKKHDIEMVFDADPDSNHMWRRHGIFVFDCRQRGH